MPNGGEFLLLIVLALVILGPDKLPGYAAKLAQLVRSARDMAEGATVQIKEELGPGFEDVDWRALDPRQYDPRRIVREALATPGGGAGAHARAETETETETETESGRAANEAAIAADRGAGPGLLGARFDPRLPTPWDVDAT